jgi:hypothetical protein
VPPHAPDVLIIGGGAAGLATAIFLRRQSPRAVTVVDGARTLGAKILVSGGGRCNVTNAVVGEGDFWGGRRTIVRQVLRAFPATAAIDFFRELGIALHEEDDGKLFPDSNRARDVLDALLREADRVGVRILTGVRALDIARDSPVSAARFAVTTASGELSAGAVVLATGGRSLPKSGSDGTGYGLARRLGHSLIETTPALVPLLVAGGGPHTGIAGVAHDAELTLWQDGRAAWRGAGALLWTHFGISGPVALNASRHWERARLAASLSGEPDPQVRLTVSFCPGRSFEDVDRQLIDAGQARPRASARSILADWLPASVAAAIVDRLALADAPLSQLPREERRRLTHALTASPLDVTGTRGYTHAEVTAGGVPLDEIDPATLESRVCANLFLVGEILDVDGRLGGFNFQWAWSSAFVAARAIARSES